MESGLRHSRLLRRQQVGSILAGEREMGQAGNKKQSFLAAHPWCCFCGGDEPATSIDHVPARTCFKGRAGPEGFEFPACAHCQTASRLDEMAFAFYVQALDQNLDNLDERAIHKAITGLANNLPHLLPNPYMSAREKRATLKELDINKPNGRLMREMPVIAIDPEIHDRVLRYGRKIASALYYREQGRVASAEHCLSANWGQVADQRFRDVADIFKANTPFIDRGKRTNLDFGDRFGYRCNKCSDPDVMMALVGFGLGLHLVVFVADPTSATAIIEPIAADVDNAAEAWVFVKENYPRADARAARSQDSNAS